MDLKECVEKIIDREFKANDYFDSHTVINLICRDPTYHKAYLQEFNGTENDWDVAQFHGKIAQKMIGKSDKVEFVAKNSMSLNIYGEISPNALWRKK